VKHSNEVLAELDALRGQLPTASSH